MNILIPMAGAGQRFVDYGYKTHKPLIPVYSHIFGVELPMVVCATQDLPYWNKDDNKIFYIIRDFHHHNNLDQEIKKHISNAHFIQTNELTQGQASSCLLAREYINNEQELLIASCDNSMLYNLQEFNILKQNSDVIVFTFTKNIAVIEKPQAYGWVNIAENNIVKDVSVKKPISDQPHLDQAIVATFWFKKGKYFVENAEEMIRKNDRINNEFYVDQVIKYCLINKLVVKYFQIDKYLCFGTPQEYQNYHQTIKYWLEFYTNEFK